MENYIDLIKTTSKDLHIFKYFDNYYFFDSKHIKAHETDKIIYDFFDLGVHSFTNESIQEFQNLYSDSIYNEVIEEISTVLNLNSGCKNAEKKCDDCNEEQKSFDRIHCDISSLLVDGKTFLQNANNGFDKLQTIINSLISLNKNSKTKINLIIDGTSFIPNIEVIKRLTTDYGNKFNFIISLNHLDIRDRDIVQNLINLRINLKMVVNDDDLQKIDYNYENSFGKGNFLTEIILNNDLNLQILLEKISNLGLKKVEFLFSNKIIHREFIDNFDSHSHKYLSNLIEENKQVAIQNLFRKIYQLHYSQGRKKNSLALCFNEENELFIIDNYLKEKIKIGDIKQGINKEYLNKIENIFNSSLHECQTCWAKSLCGGGRLLDIIGENFIVENRDSYVCNSLKKQFETAIHFHSQIMLQKPELLPKSVNNSKEIDLKLQSDKYKITFINP